MTTMTASLGSRYEYVGELGKGAFGSVCKVRRLSDGVLLACKSVKYAGMRMSHKEQLVAEVNIMRDLKHAHIVRYVDRSIDKKTGILHILMELCEGGDLALLVRLRKRQKRPLSEERLWRITRDISLALKDCHARRILHRDLKPANVLFDSRGNVKLADFGLAKECSGDDLAQTKCGTPLYSSPEVVRGQPYGAPADLWSFGCLLFEAAVFRPPFDARSEHDLKRLILSAAYDPITNYSSSFASLVAALLRSDASSRLDASAVLDKCANAVFNEPTTAGCYPLRVLHANTDLEQRKLLLDKREAALNERERKLDARERLLNLNAAKTKPYSPLGLHHIKSAASSLFFFVVVPLLSVGHIYCFLSISFSSSGPTHHQAHQQHPPSKVTRRRITTTTTAAGAAHFR